jgi:hypothetical protein
MKWFKHDSTAHMDARIKKLKHKYGIVGYGLYWYCIELIAFGVEKNNISFELEEDAETIALEWNVDQLKVQEIMMYIVELGLFEQDNGMITCMKLARRLDDTNSKNPEMRQVIAKLNGSKSEILRVSPKDSAQTKLDKTKLDKTKLDKTKVSNSKNSLPAVNNNIVECEFEVIQNLYNSVIDNNKPNWSKLTIINDKRKGKIKKLITFAKQRIKQSSDANETSVEYIGRLLSALATDEFYSGHSRSGQYPNGYKWDFEGITSENHVIKFIEREI